MREKEMGEKDRGEKDIEEKDLSERLDKIRNGVKGYRKGKTWMPTVAGIFNTITGVFGLIGGLGLTFAGSILRSIIPLNTTLLAIVLIIIGIVATAGGICALTRRRWAVAVVGSVFASILLFFLGIPAIIFTALSKDAFQES